jgi:transposase-like protein
MTAPARGPGHRYTPQEKRRARRLFKQHGWAAARIARYLSVPYDRVRAWTSDLRPGVGNQRRYDRSAILRDAPALTRAQLRAKYGCSGRFLSDLLAGKLDPTTEPHDEEPKLDKP